MNKGHPNMWAVITCLQNEEVHFRQQMLKVTAGAQKTKTKKMLAWRTQINTLVKRFENDEINRVEHLEGSLYW